MREDRGDGERGNLKRGEQNKEIFICLSLTSSACAHTESGLAGDRGERGRREQNGRRTTWCLREDTTAAAEVGLKQGNGMMTREEHEYMRRSSIWSISISITAVNGGRAAVAPAQLSVYDLASRILIMYILTVYSLCLSSFTMQQGRVCGCA